jgi:hypothetical protein
MPQSEHQKLHRNRFVLRFFCVGTFVPVALVIVGFLLGPRGNWKPDGTLGPALLIFTWVIWPTWVFMFDAEHAYQIILTLMFAAPANGVWYGAVGLLG